MRKLILSLPVAALAVASGLLISSESGVFAGSEPLPAPEATVAARDNAVEQSTADWVETKKKPKPKKSAHKP